MKEIEEKWEKELEEEWNKEIKYIGYVAGNLVDASKNVGKQWYLAACHKRQEEIEQLLQRVKELERLLCISHDYIKDKWDMDTEPLCQIDMAVKAILGKAD